MKTIIIDNKEQVEEVIRLCKVCYVGVVDAEGKPYVVPMNFGYEDDSVYFHGANSGKLFDSLKQNPEACVTFCTDQELAWQDANTACSYTIKGKSVIVLGKVEFVNDYDKKVDGLNVMMKNYTNREFKYNPPSINNVVVYKFKVEKVTASEFGVPHKKNS